MRAVLAEAAAKGLTSCLTAAASPAMQTPAPGPSCMRENASASSFRDDTRRDTLGCPAAPAPPAGACRTCRSKAWSTIRGASARDTCSSLSRAAAPTAASSRRTRWRAAPWRWPANRRRPPDLAARWIEVEHGRQALALAARNFYGRPDERLGLTGITGTNGKTTTAYLIDSVLRAAGHTTALIGTIEYHLAGRVLPAVNTTPESLDLIRLFAELEARRRHARHHGGLLPRAGAGAGLRPAFPHRRLHQPDARPPGFSRHHGGLLRGQADAVCRRRRAAARALPCSIATTSTPRG